MLCIMKQELEPGRKIIRLQSFIESALHIHFLYVISFHKVHIKLPWSFPLQCLKDVTYQSVIVLL